MFQGGPAWVKPGSGAGPHRYKSRSSWGAASNGSPSPAPMRPLRRLTRKAMRASARSRGESTPERISRCRQISSRRAWLAASPQRRPFPGMTPFHLLPTAHGPRDQTFASTVVAATSGRRAIATDYGYFSGFPPPFPVPFPPPLPPPLPPLLPPSVPPSVAVS